MFKRRQRTATVVFNLQRFLPLVEALGSDGMSSDEEDDRGVFRIIRKPFVSTEVTSVMSAIDEVFRTEVRRRSGSHMRVRLPGPDTNGDAKPVPGLPVNCYDSDWLGSLSSADAVGLRIRKTRMDLSLDT